MKQEYSQEAQLRWQQLRKQPEAAACWDWYALLRLVQCATANQPRLGYGIQLADDPVRLGQPPFFHPPALTVAALEDQGPRDETDDHAVSASVPFLYSYHFGLFGPFGPLPLHLTEIAYRQARSKSPALAAFCDVLHHRFLCFFFRAWADARKEIELDRPSAPSPADDDLGSVPREPWASGERLWELYVGALIGLGLVSLRQRDRVPDHAKLFYAGRLIQPTRNAEGLQAILGDYFQLPARVITFVPRTVRLPQNICCRLDGNGEYGRLGFSAILGESYEDHQLSFRIRLGPLHYEQFERFLPRALGMGELHDWVRFYTGRETDSNPEEGLEAVWDLQLILLGSEVPQLTLGHTGRLGWTTWLISQPCTRDVEDLVLHPPDDLSTSAANLENRAEAVAAGAV